MIHDVLLCGRDVECQLLLQAYHRSSKRCSSGAGDSSVVTPKQELVLIQGHSGIGKTTLAQTIVNEVTERDLGFFLSGKFELSDVRNPYDVFVSAFGELPEMLQGQANCNNDHDKVRQAILEAVGADGKLLSDMIPVLKGLFGEQAEASHAHGMEALHRFQFVFSKFVRAISCVVPLVLFIDDLQWSDPSNLNLLQAILESQPEDNQHSSLLVICSYRSEGLAEEPPAPEEPRAQVNGTTSSVLESSRSSHFKDFFDKVTCSSLINVSVISLQNLDEEATGRLVAEHLQVSPEASSKLSPIIYRQSGGNPFHVVQLLGPLMRNRERNENEKEQQELEIDNIFQVAELTRSVDEFLCQKLSRLPMLAQKVLQVAACMGDCIDHPALCTVLDGNVSGVEQSLETSLTEGFLVYEPKLGLYRFSHDRYRQVALSTIDDTKTTFFQIGHQLWVKSSPSFLNTKMFVVVNLLNNGVTLIQDRAERYKAAAINLEAGMKAVSLAAFQDAARYFRSGIEFLEGGVNFWNDEYALSLSLFNASADAELCNQNFDRVSYLVEEVFQRGRTVKDKLSAYVVHINSLGQRGNMEAATQVGVEVMRLLGEPLPRKVTNTTILVEIVKTRIALRGRSNETLLLLPRMQDENKIACMYVLTNLLPYAFQASSNYLAVISARLVRLCLLHGMHRWSANGFSSFGFVLCTVDRNEGYRLGQLALSILERYSGKESLPRVYVSVYAIIDPWLHHLDESLKPLEYATEVGMEIGDVEFAMLALSCHATYLLYKGAPLPQVDLKLNEAIRRLHLLHEYGLVVLEGVFHQYVHFLTGKAPLAALDEIWPPMVSTREVDSQLIPYAYNMLKAELAYLFGDLGLAAQTLEKNRLLGFAPVVTYMYAKMTFVEAFICTSLVRNRLPGKRKNVAIVKQNLKRLTAWAKDCPQNFLHKQHLVEAELMSLNVSLLNSSRRKRHVQQRYDFAVEEALREGFLNEAALANELAGDFMNRHGDSALARQYWDAAISVYIQWGATEKVKHLSART